jgi:hypothetical protein
MKILSALLILVAFAGCDTKPIRDVTGKYVSDTDKVKETLDLAKGGTAMHSIEYLATSDPEWAALFASFKLNGAQWSGGPDSIKLVGFIKDEKEGDREVVWVFQVETNGDLVRHDNNGEFVRFRKM